MATVYKAYQPALDRYVAVKVLPEHLAEEPGFAQRFRREARAVARLEHPHILAVYDSGQEGGLSYIVMRYVEAGTLKDVLGQPMELWRVADLVSQIAEALDHAHARGIVHRDIKPSNVLLDKGDWALLTDFGLARMMEATQEITASGVGLGTPAYMSPEQGLGKRVDHRSDVYSLGIMLCEMLTGRVPYEAETPMAVVLKHINAPLPLPRAVNSGVPEAVERVVLKGMAKAPEDRFQKAGELAQSLREALRGAEAPSVQLESSTIPAVGASQDQVTLRRQNLRRILAWALPVAASIITLVLLLPRVPLRVQIVGGRIELVMLEGSGVTARATPASDQIPWSITEPAQEALPATLTSISNEGFSGQSLRTPIAGPAESLGEVAATYGPDAPFYDDFEHEGDFDSGRWAKWKDTPTECIIHQSGGLLRFTNQQSEDPLICAVSILERIGVRFESLGYVEAEFYAVGDARGDYGAQAISFYTEDLQGENWYANCGIQWDGNYVYSAYSLVANWGRDQAIERLWSVPAQSKTWYRMRLEVDATTAAFKCYVDDQLIDTYIPKDAEDLRAAQFGQYLFSYVQARSLATFWADNVRISESSPRR